MKINQTLAILFAIITTSCSQRVIKSTEVIKLELLDTEVLSRGDISPKHRSNLVHFDNYTYDSLPVNKLDIKISNVGEKTQVIFVKNDLDKCIVQDMENLGIQVYKGEKKIEPQLMPILVQPTMKAFGVRKNS